MSMDHPVRKPISAPAPTRMRLPSNDIVHFSAAKPPHATGGAKCDGRLKGIHFAFASRKNATTAPTSPKIARSCAFPAFAAGGALSGDALSGDASPREALSEEALSGEPLSEEASSAAAPSAGVSW